MHPRAMHLCLNEISGMNMRSPQHLFCAHRSQRTRHAIAWLEVVLALSIVALLLQFFPGTWWMLLAAMDVRSWSSSVWFVLNISVVLVLVVIRFAPALVEIHELRLGRMTEHREKTEHQRRLKEERELLERMREARKKQVV
jgi:hypothetical protein